jgi:alanine racemase
VAGHRPTRAIIHLSHLRANLEAVRHRVGAICKVWAIIKADAYGHGMLPAAGACLAAGAYGFGVATVDEAVGLRERFSSVPILLLGPSFPEDAPELTARRIETAVGDLCVAEALSRAALRQNETAQAHLKVDTGMGRFGFAAESLGRVAASLTALPAVRWKGIFTHFAVSDAAGAEAQAYTNMQLRWLRRAVQDFSVHLPTGSAPPMLHACNSGGILQHPAAFLDAVRPGIMLYGHLPDPECAATIPLLPVMTLKTRIVSVRVHPQGSTLSYGRTYQCPDERRIGILPVGYGDGYSRALSNCGEVVIRGRRAPIRGRVCMDQTLVDITEIPEADVGEEVILFGGPPGPDGRLPLPVSELAERLRTIPYEITCLVGRRVPRVYEP